MKTIIAAIHYESMHSLEFFDSPKEMLNHILEVYENEDWIEKYEITETNEELIFNVKHSNECDEEEELKTGEDESYIYTIDNNHLSIVWFFREYHFDSDNDLDFYIDSAEVDIKDTNSNNQIN